MTIPQIWMEYRDPYCSANLWEEGIGGALLITMRIFLQPKKRIVIGKSISSNGITGVNWGLAPTW